MKTSPLLWNPVTHHISTLDREKQFRIGGKKEKTHVHTRKGKTLSLSRPQFSSSSGAINIRARTSFCLFVVFLEGKRAENRPAMFSRVKNIQPFRRGKNIDLYIYNSEEVGRNSNVSARTNSTRNLIIIFFAYFEIYNQPFEFTLRNFTVSTEL